MVQLTAPRAISRLAETSRFPVPVAAGVTILQSALTVLANGVARPGRTGQGGTDVLKAADAATYKAAGIATQTVTGGAQDGDVVLEVQGGVFNFVNSAGADAIGADDRGRRAFIVDDQTVASTSAGGTRAEAGIILNVDQDGVWVLVGLDIPADRRVQIVPFAINQTDTLAGTPVELISPVKGEIIGLDVIVQAAVTTGGAVTASVNGVAVDGLSCAVANAATKGTIVSDRPTAGHATTLVNPGDRLQVIPAAAFDTAGAVSGHLVIAY